MNKIKKAIRWIKNHTIPEGGIVVSSQNRIGYPEVTGYLIPTLLSIGEERLAHQYTDWLITIQHEDGSFKDPNGREGYAFDTGQVVRGWVAILEQMPELERPLRKACDWIIETADSQTGRLLVPSSESWNIKDRGKISEGVHLYVLGPLRRAGEILKERRYLQFVNKSLNYYLTNLKLTDFTQPNALTHFYGYIQEALLELGFEDMVREGMASVADFQQPTGAVPGYHDVNWVCSVGLAQMALVWYRIGEIERADKAMEFLERLQNPSGGFFGSYGVGANYFPSEEISWAVKFYIDALLQALNSSRNKPQSIQRFTPLAPLKKEEWHRVLIGRVKPSELAENIRQGRVPEWTKPLMDNTNENDVVVELGSGTGELSAYLAYHSRRVVLVDYSQESLNFSREVFRHLGLSGEFILADVTFGLPFTDNYADLVFSSGLLEHFIDSKIIDILKESARISKRKVISLVPNANSIPYRLGKFFQEEMNIWPWGRETPRFTLQPHFKEAGLANIYEYSIAPLHALEFLEMVDADTIKGIWKRWYASLSPEELNQINQGYLLVTIGEVVKE